MKRFKICKNKINISIKLFLLVVTTAPAGVLISDEPRGGLGLILTTTLKLKISVVSSVLLSKLNGYPDIIVVQSLF